MLHTNLGFASRCDIRPVVRTASDGLPPPRRVTSAFGWLRANPARNRARMEYEAARIGLVGRRHEFPVLAEAGGDDRQIGRFGQSTEPCTPASGLDLPVKTLLRRAMRTIARCGAASPRSHFSPASPCIRSRPDDRVAAAPQRPHHLALVEHEQFAAAGGRRRTRRRSTRCASLCCNGRRNCEPDTRRYFITRIKASSRSEPLSFPQFGQASTAGATGARMNPPCADQCRINRERWRRRH